MRRAGLALAAAAAGCHVTPSEELATDALWARMLVAHQDDQTVIAQAMLTTGGPTGSVVDLTGGDHLEVEGVRMTEWTDTVTDYHWNRAVIEATPDAAYQIVLVRPDEEIATTVVTPAEPAITGTDPAGVVGYGEALTVTWDATEPADGVEVRVEGDCVTRIAVSQLPDTGSYTTEPLRDGGVLADCAITVRVIRGFTRGVAPAYQGGWSESYRADALSIDYDSLGGT